MFDRYSGFVRHFCREGPILRNPETGRTSFPRSRTCGRSALSPAAFPVLSPGARYISGRIIQCPGNSSCFFSLVFRRVAGIAARRGLSSETERCGSEDRCVRMPNRPGIPAPVRPVGQPACLHPSRRLVDRRRRHPIPLGRIRQSYISLCGGHTRPGVAISPNRGLRPADCVSDRLPVTRSPPTEGSSCAKAKASETRNPVRQGI